MEELDREYNAVQNRVRIRVPFEVALKAKLKGFNYITEDVFQGDPLDDWFGTINEDWDEAWLSDHWERNYLSNPHFVPAPSQGVLQMWLKDVHNIDVWAQPYLNRQDTRLITDGTYSFFIFRNNNWVDDGCDFEDYHTALDEGLSRALTTLPNKV